MMGNVGQITATFDITVDTTPESRESFFLNLVGTRRVFILNPVVEVTILDTIRKFCTDYTLCA